MMRILWLSNGVLSEQDRGGTGSWLDPMAQGLARSGMVELGNIAQGNVAMVTRRDCGPIQQWVLPSKPRPRRDGLPTTRIVGQLIKAVENFRPDLVHVWGTEGFWGLLTARELVRGPALLEMQGLKGVCARVFSGGLSFREQLGCVGFKEVVRRSAIFQGRKRFVEWGVFEKEIILGHSFITTQSAMTAAWVRAANMACRMFHNDLALRGPFHTSLPWACSADPVVFCSAPYPVPYKGLHVAIRAVAIVKKRFPEVRLRIAGALQRPGLRRDGYVAWINREARRLGVETNVDWLGPLSATQIVSELMRCSAMVLPTFVETYCVALAEAMILGVPSVVSYTGGTSYLAKDEKSALFFPPGDEAMCAYQLERVLTDPDLAMRLSRRSREVALVRNDPERIVRRQIEIYRQVTSGEVIGGNVSVS